MAVKQTLVDDLDNSLEDAQTRTFSIEGSRYEIDLVDTHYTQLQEALAPFIQAGRRVSSFTPQKRPGKAPKNLPAAQREQLEAVRSWARSQGHEVSSRGRVPAAIMEAFREAHQPTAALPKRPAKKAEAGIFSEAGT